MDLSDEQRRERLTMETTETLKLTLLNDEIAFRNLKDVINEAIDDKSFLQRVEMIFMIKDRFRLLS
tara:strand:+ start:368 stop:565 length:198 start_codon:yes stop_codon:yes gene_type:complete